MRRFILLVFFLLGMIYPIFSQSWERISTGFNYILMGIEFPGGQSQVGFAGGESVTYIGDGIVIKTANGGTSWTQLWAGTDQGIEGISFPDQNTGYVCGWSAYFAKTTNGGVNWVTQNPGSDIYIYNDVVFKDATHGVVTAQTNTGGGVFFTGDGGATWTPGTGLAAIPYGLCHVSGDTYFLVTNTGDIQKSTNGGLTWTTVHTGAGLLLGIDFYDSMTGMAAGEDGKIFKTYDGGTSWQQQTIAGGYPLWHDFAWYDQNTVYVCGTPEMIYKSTNGGSSWVDDYPQSTYDPALYEILFTDDGTGYICGSQGWFYRLAPQLQAAFTADNTTLCHGSSVQFTDQSQGSPTGWNWTFEGGAPATSTLQNPLVTYATNGVYDVTLTVTKGALSNTLVEPDMIHVEGPVTESPLQPTGPTEICGLANYEYTTQTTPEASGYSWVATPATAGTFSGTGLTGTLAASNTWNGAFTVKVAGTNSCGNGPYSPELACTLYHQPVVYSLYAGGGYCTGDPGYEVRLEDSETGVDYELFENGATTGLVLPGTGELLSFGYQTLGNYTVTGSNGNCTSNMQGVSQVFIIPLPGQAAQPAGPNETCNNMLPAYTTTLPENSYWLIWTLTPAEAGTVTQQNITTAAIAWNVSFSGTASLAVQGANECGEGLLSPPLDILVNPAPTPVVSGNTSVCTGDEANYNAGYSTGSTYQWSVTGGTIISGQGSDNISVLWGGNPGTGEVVVTETTQDGCTAISTALEVAIEICPGIITETTVEFRVFPIPAKDEIYILAGSAGSAEADITIYNQAGKLVYERLHAKVETGLPFRIDISQFESGAYTLQVISEKEVHYRMIIKVE